MHVRLARLAELMRRHSLEVVRSCVRNCECLCAYKLHRAQQVYHTLWGIPHSRSLLRALRSRTFLLGASTLAIFDWDTHRITEKTLRQHYTDIDEAKQLTIDTLTCQICRKRVIVDMPAPGIMYCSCKSAYVTAKQGTQAWIPFLERKDLLVWRRERIPNSGLFEYKVYGAYPEICANAFLQVQVDPDYRMEWDESAVQVRVVEVDDLTGSQILYWEMKWPKLFSNRDYVYNRRFIVDKKKNIIVIRSEIVDHPDIPEIKGKYRVKDYCCTMVIKPDSKLEEPGIEFCMTYFDNPGVSIPTAIQTWVATSAMPDFLVRLRNASIVYSRTHPEAAKKGPSNGPAVFTVFNEAVRVS